MRNEPFIKIDSELPGAEELPIDTTSYVKITIRIDPQPARFIKTRYGIAPAKEHVDYIKKLLFWLKPYALSFTDKDVPLAMMVTFFIRRPASVKRTHMTVKPDLSNLIKPLEDALKPYKVKRKLIQEGVIPDDAQITDLYVRKRYTTKLPKVVIKIWTYAQLDAVDPDHDIQGILKFMP